MAITEKRGFLLAEETLKFVIAFICIIFLVYFLTSLYFSSAQEKEFAQAQRLLSDSDQSVKKTIEGLSEGETREIILDSPNGWHLLSFTQYPMPNQCAGKNCICICDEPLVSYFSSQEGKCDEKGAGTCEVFQNLEGNNINVGIDKDLKKIKIAKTGGKVFAEPI